MIGNKTNAALYTVVKNNTDKRVILTSYGNMKNGNIAPGGYLAVPGYLFDGVSDMRMANVYNTMRNGSISIFMVLRTDEGYKTIQLSDTSSARFTDADADALFLAPGAAQHKQPVKSTHTQPAAQTRPQRSDDGFTITAVGRSNKMAAAIGAKVADEQPIQHAALNTDLTATHGAAKVAAGNTEAIKEAARAQNRPKQAATEAEAPADTSKMSREELKAAVDECYATKDWLRLLQLLAIEWPGVEFNKQSVMRLRSLDGIMAKYELL